jgi:hypothetical protein
VTSIIYFQKDFYLKYKRSQHFFSMSLSLLSVTIFIKTFVDCSNFVSLKICKPSLLESFKRASCVCMGSQKWLCVLDVSVCNAS